MNIRHLFPIAPLLVAALVVLGAAVSTWAQTVPPPPAPAAYGYGYYGGGHSSTAAEGALNGLSNVISSAGSANLSNSQAAINYEAARAANFENHLKYTETYFQMREKNRAYREAEAGPRATSQDLFRWAKEEAPNRLASTQLDPLSGDIAWPILLRGREFEPARLKLDLIYAARATYHGGISQENYLSALTLIRAMQDILKAGVKVYPPQDYVTSKSFLESLGYELRLPAS